MPDWKKFIRLFLKAVNRRSEYPDQQIEAHYDTDNDCRKNIKNKTGQ